MGLLDFFTGGSGPEKALKLKPKIVQKYGEAQNRQKAIHTLGEMRIPEAVAVLMARYTITVDPHTTDADEKDTVFSFITGMGEHGTALKNLNEKLRTQKKPDASVDALRDATRALRTTAVKSGKADREAILKVVAATTGASEADAKELTHDIAVEFESVARVREFLRRSDSASSWAIRILEVMIEPDELIGIVCEELHRLGTEYSRDPEKKQVLLQWVDGKADPRIPAEVLLLLEDMSDDIKIAALKALAPLKYEAAREPMLKLLVEDETAKRVQTAAIAALHESSFTVQGYREKVEKRLSDPWYLDGGGAVKKRGAAA